jgi:hypothetical protein
MCFRITNAVFFSPEENTGINLELNSQYLLCQLIRCMHGLASTQSIPNYKTFDFFDTKFDHSSYSRIYVKYHFFCRSLVY